MGIVFFSPLVAALSSQGSFFFLSSLRSAISTGIAPSLSSSLLFSTTRDLFVWVLPFSHPKSLLSHLRIFFSTLRFVISIGTTLCFCYS